MNSSCRHWLFRSDVWYPQLKVLAMFNYNTFVFLFITLFLHKQCIWCSKQYGSLCCGHKKVIILSSHCCKWFLRSQTLLTLDGATRYWQYKHSASLSNQWEWLTGIRLELGKILSQSKFGDQPHLINITCFNWRVPGTRRKSSSSKPIPKRKLSKAEKETNRQVDKIEAIKVRIIFKREFVFFKLLGLS